MANQSILNAFERMWQHVVASLAVKSDVDHTHNYAGSSSVGGAATSAEKLTTARTINGVSFDGSANITTPATFGVTTSGTGAAYTATVEGVTALTAGVSFTMIPNVVSTSTAPTLNVNGLGAKTIRRRVSSATTSTTTGYAAAWLAANKPIKVEYDGVFWIADLPAQNASDLYGTVPITKGGTGATDAATALANLGAAPAYTYGTSAMTASSSALTTGTLYFQYV